MRDSWRAVSVQGTADWMRGSWIGSAGCIGWKAVKRVDSVGVRRSSVQLLMVEGSTEVPNEADTKN